MLDVNNSHTSIKNKSVIEREPLLDLLFQEAPDAIIILETEDYSILEINPKAIELFEAENLSSLKGFHFFKLLESELTEFSRNLLEMNLRKNQNHSQELSFRTLKQNVFWGRLNTQAYKSGEKEYVLLRIKKTVDYHKTEELLSTLLRGTARITGHKFFKELTRLICKTFNVSYAFIAKISDNRKYLNIVESTSELTNVDPEKFTLDSALFENVIRGNTTFYPKGLKNLFPDDKFLITNKIEGFMGAPIFGNSGEIIGLIGLMDNEPISEVPNSRYILSIFASRTAAEIQRIRLKEILKEQVRSLTNSNDVKDKLLSVISHDLVNPLHTIMGFSELLRNKIDKYEKDKIIERVEIIDNSIRNIYFLLDDLTCWSNFYRDNVKITRDFISINELIEENLSLFKYIIEIKDLSVSITGKLDITVYSDKRMINGIIRNILSNAVKFTPKQGKIEIRVRENRTNISISILDTGIGMTSEIIDIISKADINNPDLLFSGKKSTSLGLLLSRSFAERIGGNLKIDKSQQNGTSVKISIPKE